MTWQPTETDITSRVAFDLASSRAVYFWTTSVSTRAAIARSRKAAGTGSLTDCFDSVPNATGRAQALEIALRPPLLHQLKEFNGAAAVRIVCGLTFTCPSLL